MKSETNKTNRQKKTTTTYASHRISLSIFTLVSLGAPCSTSTVYFSIRRTVGNIKKDSLKPKKKLQSKSVINKRPGLTGNISIQTFTRFTQI